jgi:hypothetical protein
MRTLVAVWLVVSLSIAGCGGNTHYDESSSDDDWSSSGTSGSSTATSDVDAGIDAALDAGNPVRDRAMALFARSCTPCHRHSAPVDADAVAQGVYLETETEILAYTRTYAIGNTPTNLASIIAQRAEGYELMVGADQRTPMPPRGSSYPGFTEDEARQITEWFRSQSR